jgi:hypothetical protein
MVTASSQNEIQSLSFSVLSSRCAQESEHFFSRQVHDPRFCFEIFRRAISERHQQGWSFLYQQYQPLVAGWVERHSLFAHTGEENQYFVNGAFEKMWKVMTPEKFSQFPDLKSILRYLQMCVHSVITDHVRKKEENLLLDDVPSFAKERSNQNPDIEQSVVTRDQREDLWRDLTRRLKNEKELQVVYGTFVLGLKPREILAEFPGVFRDVEEIYQIKANVIDRLRRDRDFRESLSNF